MHASHPHSGKTSEMRLGFASRYVPSSVRVYPDVDRRGYDVAAQAGDLSAMLDACHVDAAHVVALCGGAAVALAADVTRVRSLSLWHGDYELGPDIPKTSHQRDVQTLMLMAGRHRNRAAGLQALLSRPTALENLRADLAHLLIYPYAGPELLYRYGRLNGAIMTTDCRPLLAGVQVPTLVVSSRADTTAHPEGSVFVAAHIAGAKLELLPTGDPGSTAMSRKTARSCAPTCARRRTCHSERSSTGW
jgi:3-oxoadipate enol-lactonase